jgi:probable rRNA maturation factor
MTVLVSDEHPSSGVDPEHLRSLAEAVLSAEGFPPEAEVSITLVDDDEMASWNSRALGKSGPTDVLSFPVENFRPGSVPSVVPEGPPLLVGDVVIAPDYIRRQADEFGMKVDDEMALMVAHGILHLLGYDHQDDADAELMENRERVILASQGRSRR